MAINSIQIINNELFILRKYLETKLHFRSYSLMLLTFIKLFIIVFK